MKRSKLLLFTFLLLGFNLTVLQSQEVIPALGGNAAGDGGSVSYSIGQLFYTINMGANGSLLEGVQQPYEISGLTSTVEQLNIQLKLSVYPVPSTDFVNVKFDNAPYKRLIIHLIDMNGVVLKIIKSSKSETAIPMASLASGIYFVKVYNTKDHLKTFKVIKN